MDNVLNVYCNNIIAGQLKLSTNRLFEFKYDIAWIEDLNAYPLSIRLPFKKDIFLDEYSRPFFENLLPEFDIRYLIAHQFGISEKNIFGILENIGGECAGAVSLLPINKKNVQQGNYKLLNEIELDTIVNKLPKHPLMADQHLRLSLAGVQNKLPIYIADNKFYLPYGTKASSHILKPPIKHFSNTVINEYFCMVLANFMELPVPRVMIHNYKQPLYIIKRFDRVLDNNKDLIRLHQEDFCQAMGVLSEQKYEVEGGPSIKQCFELIRNFSIQPAMDLENLLKWVIFNYIIGNSDAHGKNLAFIITKDGPYLSPFYDILCTNIYPELSSKTAMKIGGENRPDWIQRRHWERLAAEVNFTNKYLKQIINYMLERYNNAVSSAINNTELNTDEQKTINQILELSKKRTLCLKKIIR